LTPFDAVYSSDAERAYETALILAERHGLRVVTDARFREVNFGHWEGLTRAQINRRFGRAFTKWLSGEARRPDGGEADEEMAERVFAALAHIFDQHPKERVLVVTSGGPIRAVEAHLLGIDRARARNTVETVPNCSLIELVIRDGEWIRDACEIADPS
jgi:broad specificity phosphatase PhoE